MDKLEYELNQVAVKATLRDAVKAIKMLKRRNCTSDEILQEMLRSYGDELSRDKIEQLVEENC